MLAVAYVLRLDDLRREVESLNAAIGMSVVMGGTGERLDWSQIRAEFDADLAAPPDGVAGPVESGRSIRLRALGMRE